MTSTSFGTLNTGGADKHKQLTTTEERNAHRTNDAVPHSPRFSNFSSQAQVQLGTANTIENHLHWLRNHEVRPWNERGVWFPSSFYSERAVENIEWGRVAGAVAGSVLTDESGKKAFEKALRLQDIEGAGCLSLVELDVQGLDSKGNRVRVQQIIEIKLGKTTHMTEKGTVERTTMTLKRVLKISTPDPSPYQTNSETRDQYATVARELAQHEVNKAFDERNAYLRDVFGLKVDHVRKRRSSTIPTHSWSFQRPEIWIRGPDGTVMGLNEKRMDCMLDNEVILTYEITVEQVRGEDEGNHLFDLSIEGCESERRVREARWKISEAIERGIASGSDEGISLESWVKDICGSRD